MTVAPTSIVRGKSSPPLGFRYLGPLICDTAVPGERKADGVTPAHPGGGALRLDRNRWIIFFATLDPRGWDANRSILYQLRRDAPDGAVIVEGVIARCREDWDPFDDGQKLFKSCGMPIAFGVPRGATHHGRDMPNANVFVIKWYRWAHRPDGGRLLHPSHHRKHWPQGLATKHGTLRVEWMQFRLNDAGDDIEPLTRPAMLRQRGYESGDAFCSLGAELQMNHSMKSPVPCDETCRDWIEYDGFVPYRLGSFDHHAIAAVHYRFNETMGLYEWIETGPLAKIDGRVIGEASVNRVDGTWIIAARSFEYTDRHGCTCWFRTDDPMKKLGRPHFTPAGFFPRTVFVCGDGVLRLFTNDAAANRHPHERAVLCSWDVDPVHFHLSNRRVLIDARAAGLPFERPFVDMPKLCPARGRRQLLFFRAIDQSHTANIPARRFPSVDLPAVTGIHAIEFTYDKPAPDEWHFAEAT